MCELITMAVGEGYCLQHMTSVSLDILSATILGISALSIALMASNL